MKKVIVTGSTGMVGKGVLLQCLDSPEIEKVLVVNRRSVEMTHDKLEEVLLSDFTQAESLKEQLKGYDGCFWCMGVSAIGLSEADYSRITYETTHAFAEMLHGLNPGMVFNYVSGTGTDSSEKGRAMWARVKGRTENMVLNMGFKDAYAFRPGFIVPERGIQSNTGWYNFFYVILKPLFPVLKKSNSITTTTRLGQAMINSMNNPQDKKHLENRDINAMAGHGNNQA